MHKAILVTVAVVAGATAAFAHVGVKDPAVMARMHNMKDSAAALEVLGGMAKGEVAYDAARAEAARAELLVLAAAVPALFKGAETDPLTEARPEIWDNWPDFEAKAMMAEEAVAAMTVGDAQEIAASLRPVGAACSACHELYRVDP